jgi:hypothetical protein
MIFKRNLSAFFSKILDILLNHQNTPAIQTSRLNFFVAWLNNSLPTTHYPLPTTHLEVLIETRVKLRL